MLPDEDLRIELKRRAVAAGFMDCGVAPAALRSMHSTQLNAWLAGGMHGEMEYMAPLADKRATGADHVLPGAQSVIVFAAAYQDGRAEAISGCMNLDGGAVRIAGYATGEDYHYILRERLQAIVVWLSEIRPGHQWRICVDSAPLMERAYAVEAGLGFIGRNSMMISWMRGSYTLLAEIVTTASIAPDTPKAGTCGQCTRCIDACPTNAIVPPGLIDARRCISYLTIEKKTELSLSEMAATGDWAFGCDICQDVCPYNKAPAPLAIAELGRTLVCAVQPAGSLLEAVSNSQFERRFARSPIVRPGRRRVQRLIRSKVQLAAQGKGATDPAVAPALKVRS